MACTTNTTLALGCERLSGVGPARFRSAPKASSPLLSERFSHDLGEEAEHHFVRENEVVRRETRGKEGAYIYCQKNKIEVKRSREEIDRDREIEKEREYRHVDVSARQ